LFVWPKNNLLVISEIVVSIIIVNYNTRDLTRDCLSSIYHNTRNLCFEIIVVDNASADGSQQMIKSEFPNVILIESPDNLGFGKANNLGSTYAVGKFLLFLNSDTILLENTVKVFSDYMQQANDSTIAVVGCNMFDGDRKKHVSYGNFPSALQEIFEYGLSKIFVKYYKSGLSVSVMDTDKQIKSVDYIVGACMFFKADLFRQFGGFDEEFFLYFEETELCFRLKKAGYKSMWNPNTSIIHYEGASGNKKELINYRIVEEFYKSKFLYYKKCHGIFTAKMLKYFCIPKTIRLYRKFDSIRIFRILLRAGKNN